MGIDGTINPTDQKGRQSNDQQLMAAEIEWLILNYRGPGVNHHRRNDELGERLRAIYDTEGNYLNSSRVVLKCICGDTEGFTLENIAKYLAFTSELTEIERIENIQKYDRNIKIRKNHLKGGFFKDIVYFQKLSNDFHLR